MARGTQHRKRRPSPNARVSTAAAKPARKRVKHARWEDQLFFGRLRTHVKWVFAFLAFVFAVSFVFLGVGSGSTGISDMLQNLNIFGGGSSNGGSLSSLQHATQKNPKNAQAWLNLSTKLQQQGKLDDAIDALKHYTALRPKNQSGLEQLAGLYLRQRDHYQLVYGDSQTRTAILAPTTPFQPDPNSKLGKALGTLTNPIQSAVSSSISTLTSTAYSHLLSDETAAVGVYKQLAKLSPKDASTQLQLGEAAAGASDVPTAIGAFRTFLRLAPDDPLVPKVKTALKQLEAQQKATATPGSAHK